MATAEDVAPIHGGLRRKDSWSSLLDRKECMTVDNFVLERVIGKGAFGKVMMVRVRNDPARRVYAMKVRRWVAALIDDRTGRATHPYRY